MSRSGALRLVWAALLSGCAIQNLPPIRVGPGPELFGPWEWRQSVGGIGGRVETPATRHHRESLRLEPNGLYQLFRDDTLEVSGRFTITREVTRLRPDSAFVIRWDGVLPLHSAIVELAADTLRLTDLCVDCYEHVYVRARE
jgi:hypothetical protein